MFTPAYSLDCQWLSEWVDVKSDLSLQTSELVRVLFAFCSMTPVPTTMATLCLHLWSIIGSLKLISMLGAICGSAQSMDCAGPQIAPNINTSFVDSDSCQLARPPGLCSRARLLFTVTVWLLFNKTVFIWHVYYIKIQHTSGGSVKFISTQ